MKVPTLYNHSRWSDSYNDANFKLNWDWNGHDYIQMEPDDRKNLIWIGIIYGKCLEEVSSLYGYCRESYQYFKLNFRPKWA